MSVSTDMLEFLTSAFTNPLSKAVWTELLDRYPAIEGMENVLVAPTMETGMKEDIKKKKEKKKNCPPLTKVWQSTRHPF